jgi:predicted Zn-dependent peptidase
VRAVLDAEHEKLRRDGVSPEEVRRAAQSVIGARNASLQTRESRMMEYARSIYSGAGVQSVGRYDTAVQAVTAEQLKTVIQQHTNPAALRTGAVRGKAQ